MPHGPPIRTRPLGASGWAAVLAVVLVVAPPLVGLAALPAAREGTAVPVALLKPQMAVQADTELVLIGNSKAGSDIDKTTIRATLGRPDLKMDVLSIGSATLPIYYAILKNLVLAQAHPRVIVVYATPVEILTSDLTADRRERLLRPFLTADEPVIARKLYAHTSGGFEGVRERAVAGRDGALSALAAGVAGAVTGSSGRAALDAAFGEVFGQGWARRTSITTIPMGGYPSESALPETLDESFVTETAALCEAAGVRLVFAVAPVTGAIRERETRRLKGLEPVLAQAEAHAAAWVVLPDPGPRASAWRDDEHMNERSALTNSRWLAEGLRRAGVLEE